MADRAERLRDRAHGQIVQMVRFAEKITEDTTLEAIKARLENLECRYQTFNEMELQLFENPTYRPITNEVDELYFKARELLDQACSRRAQGDLNKKHDLNTTFEQFFDQQKTFYEGVNAAQHVRLPKINIEPFSGDYKTWASFHDLFETTVHKNVNISKVHKLQMLKGLLQGEAAALIRHVQITETNYDEAWEKLYKRYNKMTSIVTTLVQTFMDQKPCARGSGAELRRLSETSDEVIRGLRVLGPQAETRDPWLIHSLLGKLDEETKKLWAVESVEREFPSVNDLITFLNKRCDALEICEATTNRSTSRSNAKSFVALPNNTMYQCVVCKQQHPMFKCPEFKNLSWEGRTKIVFENNLCCNCLKKGHMRDKCFSKSTCLICQQRHHTLIHKPQNTSNQSSNQASSNHHVSLSQSVSHQHSQELYEPQPTSQTTQPSINQLQDNHNQSSTKTDVLHAHYNSSTNTVLPTAVIYIKSRTGKLQLHRALLDSGSQSSFVTESCAQRLGLKRTNSCVSIYGLASTHTGQTRGSIDMTIYSRTNTNYNRTVTAHIMSNITNLLPVKPIQFKTSNLQLELADPQFHTPNKIDVLLGADIFFEVLNSQQQVIDGLPIVQASKLGWLIAGAVDKSSAALTNLFATSDSGNQPTNENLHQQLKTFWEVEEIPDKHESAIHECDDFYEKTTIRTKKGQFVVKLPFKNQRPHLGSSYQAAHQRLRAMETKFLKSPEFFESYKSFLNEYLSLGHMSYAPPETIPLEDDEKYYLPHHAVIKPSSTTTKLRVVFDASSKTSTGVSLNDVLQTGPNLQSDLTSILLQFRKHAIALVADIEKMYRQILVNPDDTNYQLILWRENQLEQVKTYKLNTVTYGTACAPYLAIKTLKKSTENAVTLYETAAHAINNHFYVDDLLTGCDNLQEAVLLKQQLSDILQQSGFNLRKWQSNSHEFLNSFSTDDVQHIPKLIEENSTVKTLGIIWDAEFDSFSFKVQKGTEQDWTKRKLLSTSAKLYDPLGWLAPSIVLFKMLLQKLWLLKLEWDASLPTNINKTWLDLYQSLPELETIQIPRRLTTLTSTRTQFQIHSFCDASEGAYGSVVYLRAINEFGEITVNIISAKSKVAPLKQISLPRLELCGAVLLCKLVKFCLQSLSYRNIQVYAWTDSMIVLHWLSDVPRRWKSFIGNRTAAILETIPRHQWRHVDSNDNPADAVSRGVKPKALVKLQLWWQGPQWLSQPENIWPKSTAAVVTSTPMEERSKYINVFNAAYLEEEVVVTLLTRISSWLKTRKVMTYILRFGTPTRRRQLAESRNFQITPAELERAELVLIRTVQRREFASEFASLEKTLSVPSKNQLSSLDPFIDKNGVLRVGGRLSKSSLPYSTKHPAILPKGHIICERIVRDIHCRHLHAGNSLTLGVVRHKYWMIGARYTIKRCIKSCTVCIRHRFNKSAQKMADLPTVRCTQNRPFLNTGLDYAGPLYIKRSTRKTSPVEKAYVAVFVCLAVKAVHLEVVSSLDTESFLAALKRFISRRGIPQQIVCDNGSNFIGANKELKNLKQQIIDQSKNPLISEFLLQKGIHFQFNPPHAPHFGGLWESSVKSFKYHLKRVTNTNLTFEEMTTLISQIEALLNSRPLCRIENDPDDVQILTPAHFLIGDSLVLIPEPMLTSIHQHKLSRWQNIQQRIQGFWQRWHRDYLTTLQHRRKWKVETEQIEIDDVVLIKEDNLYPSQWLLGRITAIHPGRDDITRVVTLKTSKNEIKRPVHKLIKLPVKQ